MISAARERARRAAVAALRAALRLSGRRAGVVLVYHRLAAQSGNPANELVPAHAVEAFEAQLRHLRRCYRVVRLDELLGAVAARRRGGRFPVAITFDDDLASHVELAAPCLTRLGLPATFFLCGASLDHPFSFWWERLQRAFDNGLDLPVEGGRIHELAVAIETMGSAERAALAERLGHELGPDPEDAGLRRDKVQMLVMAGLDVGFHTLHHDRLPDLDNGALAAVMVEGRSALEEVVGRRLTTIAYPHGRADTRVARAAAAADFRLGFTGDYAPVTGSSDPMRLGRIEPTRESTARFAAQLVGALRRGPHT